MDESLAEQEMFTKWPDVRWRSTWRNPVNGAEALYIAAHAFGVLGMSQEDGHRLLDDLTDAVTGPDAIYAVQTKTKKDPAEKMKACLYGQQHRGHFRQMLVLLCILISIM